jgi:hypothetical protein
MRPFDRLVVIARDHQGDGKTAGKRAALRTDD